MMMVVEEVMAEPGTKGDKLIWDTGERGGEGGGYETEGTVGGEGDAGGEKD